MKHFKYLLLSVIAVAGFNAVKAQSLPVGTNGLEDYYRRLQLLGQADSSVSFMVRPVYPQVLTEAKKPFFPDKTEDNYNKINPATSWNEFKGKLTGYILPVTLQTQFTTHHPYGWNDGALIPSKGMETMLSAGVFAKYGPLTIQLRPEAVLADNASYDTFNKGHYEVIAARYYDFYNYIDLPARFGKSSYSRLYWGQSSIRLNYKALSFGLSTENLWWGPGMRNSLLMTNTAPGFAHLTLNTSRPVNTPIGSFEGQLIAGRLENTDYGVLDPEWTFHGNPLYVPKPASWRYLSGVVFTWQPKWIPGLFLGTAQTSQLYHTDLHSLSSYFPFFSNFRKVVTNDQPIIQPDRKSTLFARWLWTSEHAEVYFEYGHDNIKNDFRNAILDPQDARAYVFGLRKMFTLNTTKDEYMMVNVEATQLQETSVSKVESAQSWYVDQYIRQGYTNEGQMLGAGIGPGGNLQTLDVSWVRGLKRIGLQLERYLHNNDFYYYAYYDSYDFRRHWVDLSIALSSEWNVGNFILNAKIQGIQSINYQWYLDPTITDQGYFVHGINAFNLQFQAGFSYRF